MISPDKYTQKAMNKLTWGGYKWELKRSIKPRRCAFTKEKIPCLAVAYRGQKVIDGPGQQFLSEKWISTEAFIMQKLKGNI